MNKIVRSAVLLLLLSAFAFGQQDKIEILDKYIEASRQNWRVPGMSVAVVRDGKVLLSKGYGVRESGKPAAVDASTLFGAMSTTKAMTAVAMGILVDEGKVAWDDKVTKHLPDFRVGDAYLTNEIRVRDLFTHNAGLPNADFLWTRDELTGDGIVSRLQYSKPSYGFRAGFVYHNVMYLVAGKVIEKASGMTWERFITERVFNPLGMKNTFPTLDASRGYQNRSASHYEIRNQITAIPEMAVDVAGPAGSVWSTADDIGKWVNFTLYNAVAADGKPLLKPATFDELFKPQVILPAMFYPTFRLTKPHWTTYGLGWFQHDYRGEMVNFHTGSLTGRTAIVGLLRDKKLGVYVFGNLDQEQLRHALMYKVFDLFAFDDNSRDWSAETKNLYDRLKAEAAKNLETRRAARQTNTNPTLPLDAYAGKYSDPYYGSIELQIIEGKLRAVINRETYADLEHWEKDSFLAKSNKAWQGESVVTFEVKPDTKEVELIWGVQRFKRQAKP